MTKQFFALLAALFFLAGCGGGGSDGTPASNPDPSPGPSPTPTILNGFVADGYLQNARICFDLNLNGMCDPDEPSVFSEQGGAYSIEVPQGHELSDLVVLAEVTTETIDEDTMAPVEYPYTLVAPYDLAEFISPISTLIYHTVASENLSLQAAQDQLAGIFGVSAEELVRDYIIYEDATLHRSAQVIASSLGALRENAIQALAENGYDENAIFNLYDPIQNLALDQVMRSLTAIIVEAAKDNFNRQNAVAIALDGRLQTADTILDALEGNTADDDFKVIPHDIKLALETGLFSFYPGPNQTLLLSARTLQEDSLGQYLDESWHRWDSTSSSWTEFTPPSEMPHGGFYYFRDGAWHWVLENDVFPDVEFVSSTVAMLDFPDRTTKMGLVGIDLSGKTMQDAGIPTPILHDPFHPFPQDSARYYLDLETLEDTYTDFYALPYTGMAEFVADHSLGGQFFPINDTYTIRFVSQVEAELYYYVSGSLVPIVYRSLTINHVTLGDFPAMILRIPENTNDYHVELDGIPVFTESPHGILSGKLFEAGATLHVEALNHIAIDALTENLNYNP
ncbi:hypothetical protein M3027_19895 [Geoalkalibacter halelectricus]|nr:hypothetical protein [Geoalkalibacter halelectricus]